MVTSMGEFASTAKPLTLPLYAPDAPDGSQTNDVSQIEKSSTDIVNGLVTICKATPVLVPLLPISTL